MTNRTLLIYGPLVSVCDNLNRGGIEWRADRILYRSHCSRSSVRMLLGDSVKTKNVFSMFRHARKVGNVFWICSSKYETVPGELFDSSRYIGCTQIDIIGRACMCVRGQTENRHCHKRALAADKLAL